jgi:aminoglycoside phosphotransferase (APT) family kinase protein
LGFAVVGALAGLHQVDYASCGLAGLGRPDGFVARQVRGWRNRWEAVAHGAAATAQPLMREVADTLERTLPAPQRSAILHNDLKLDNCQFDPADPDHVHSVFDWDMATLGDPLVDLGTLLNYWPDPADTPSDRGRYRGGLEALGMPSRAEVQALYSEATGLDLSGIGWYHAFATWKTAVVMQQLYDRYRRGETSDERMASRGDQVPELAARARRLLGGPES